MYGGNLEAGASMFERRTARMKATLTWLAWNGINRPSILGGRAFNASRAASSR
jgi:hypothetical protein